MSKFIYTLLLSFFIAAPVFALKEGDTVYVDYDLQGGVNNPDNISFFIHSDLSSVRYGLLPPTKEGAEFLGWYTTDKTPLTSNYKRDSFYPYEEPNQGNKLKIHARWGVVSKRPQMDDAGCMLVHDAAELYGAVKIADSTLKKVCIFIENDIVVNKNVLKSDGSTNSGDFYWWKPFRYFVGIIEGNGHTISGLYGNVGLIQQVQEHNTVIQNLGITDSYFSGENAGSFVSTVEFGGLKLKNVFSSASVRSTSGYVGGLVGSINSFGDLCLDPAAPDPEPDRNPSAYEFMGKSPDFFSQIENSYSTGYLMGKEGGGLVGAVDNVSFKNSFYNGKIDVSNTFSGIALTMKKMCMSVSDNDVSVKNVFYPKDYLNDGYEGTPAMATEFSNGAVLQKLKDSTDIPVWAQNSGDANPKLSGVFYDITYRLHGGTNPSNPSYYTPKQEVSLKPAVKENDVFEGWFLDSNFTKPAEKIPSTAQGNQRYYARWESGYSITYVNDGKYDRPWQRNPTYRYADSSTFVLKEPKLDGYTFEGWYTDSTFKTCVTELVQGNKDDIVLIGKWNDGTTSIRKKIAPTPFKMGRARYDIKGRSMKSRPNYGVYF
jgi:uncharacterized repeat protein (TIGR02543 family)